MTTQEKAHVRRRMGDFVIETLQYYGCDGVMWGDAGLLDDAAKRAGRYKGMHPLDRWQRVLGCLESDTRFTKSFVSVGGRLLRSFTLITK